MIKKIILVCKIWLNILLFNPLFIVTTLVGQSNKHKRIQNAMQMQMK